MAWWSSVSQLFQRGQRRGNEAQQRLVEAYQAVFQGTPRRQDQEIVMADLASYTGFFMFHPKEATDGELRYSEGMRSVFGHIHGHLTLTREQSQGLHQAARAEASASADEGDWS